MDLTILCPTYGRSQCLREILRSFELTEYSLGKLYLLIVNDVQQQTIIPSCTLPPAREVIAVNHDDRFPSLGDKRNACVGLCPTEHFLFVDDDDVFLPHYAQTTMESFLRWGKPIWPTDYFHSSGKGDGVKVRREARTHPASYLMSQAQFRTIGGYPFVYAGGDQLLRSKAFKAFACDPKNNPQRTPPGYVYRWGNGTYHISGSQEHSTAWVRTAADLQKRLDSGAEPSGDVVITPEWSVDWLRLTASATA